MAGEAATTAVAGALPSLDKPIPAGPASEGMPDAALQHRSWRGIGALSSISARALGSAEQFLDRAGFERGPWLAIGYAGGVAAWFWLANRAQWLGLIAGCLGVALLAALALARHGRHPYLRQAVIAMSLVIGAGCGMVWIKSTIVGTPPIAHFAVAELTGRVLDRYDQPAQGRFRLVLATREPRSGRVIRVRLTLPMASSRPGLDEGAVIRVRARLMPPRPPQLPGSYDFAQAAWFNGLAATGSALGLPVVVVPAPSGQWLPRIRHALAEHVRASVPGSAGGIAAAFASGDRGGIAPDDDQAMRDAGLTHLLSVSGLHVSAVVGLAYVLVIRLMALVPWLALRMRLPLAAAVAGSVAGVGYTLLTGAEVPTVRSCLGALLVMAALALGRSPLSMRLLAVAGLAVMLIWPEAVVGPSFQMSFGSVIAIIAVAQSAPARAFLAHHGEMWPVRVLRHLLLILLTGMVIDLALMPIALFHFHRAGIYGSMANVIAIPLTTFLTMPLIALALALDIVGLGGPAWHLVDLSLQFLLKLAHFTAGQPGAVSQVPIFGSGGFALFVAGMIWLALWRGRLRLYGLVPVAIAIGMLALVRPPDLLVTGDGRNLGVVDQAAGRLLILREGRSSFTRDAMLSIAGMVGEVMPISQWPGARCNRDACAIELARGGRNWRLLVMRRDSWTDYAGMDKACAGVDIVIASQKLFSPCRPSMVKIDKTLLLRTGGMAFDLENRTVRTVAEGEGEHPWWRFPHRLARPVDDTPEEAGGAEASAAAGGT